jgi:hypothetical protein
MREIIVTVDDKTYRHAWSARGEPFIHHNASIQVFAAGAAKCRVVWIADLLPDDLAQTVEEMIVQGLGVMKRTLEGSTAPGWQLATLQCAYSKPEFRNANA